MIKLSYLIVAIVFSLSVVAEDEIIVVPIHTHKVITDGIFCYVVATFEVPRCYIFQKLSRLDLVKEVSEGLACKADVFIAGFFSHAAGCTGEQSEIKRISAEDLSPLPWEYTIKSQVLYSRPANNDVRAP